jgi:hypothetical protein
MTFSKAKQEFEIRYYLWATSEFEREIDESFPSFRLFKAGEVWRIHQLIQRFERDEQLAYAHSRLKRFHPHAVTALGEGPWDVEDCLPSRPDVYRPMPPTVAQELAVRKRAGEKIRFVSKRKLRKAVMVKFKDAFGSQCIGPEEVYDEDPSAYLRMKCCGWLLQTSFWFGRRENLISYSHTIASETRITHPDNPEITGPAMVLAHGISFSAWLGLNSQTQWEYLLNEDVEPACDAVIKLCGHFFEVLPKLLKGLEFDKITAE